MKLAWDIFYFVFMLVVGAIAPAYMVADVLAHRREARRRMAEEKQRSDEYWAKQTEILDRLGERMAQKEYMKVVSGGGKKEGKLVEFKGKKNGS